MKLDMKGIFDGSVFDIDFDEFVELDSSKVGEKVKSPVNVKGSIYNTEDGIFLTGKVYTRYVDECARCLAETEVIIESDISARLVQELGPIDDEDDELYIVCTKEEIFIEDALSDIIVTSLPMKVICSEECKGLCPKCGIDLNKGSCDCEVDNVDPRLAKLKEFFD